MTPVTTGISSLRAGCKNNEVNPHNPMWVQVGNTPTSEKHDVYPPERVFRSTPTGVKKTGRPTRLPTV